MFTKPTGEELQVTENQCFGKNTKLLARNFNGETKIINLASKSFIKSPPDWTPPPPLPRVEAGWETAAGRTLLHQRPEQAHFHPARPPFRPPLTGADSSVI